MDSVVKRDEINSILLVIDNSLSIYKPYTRIVTFNNNTTGITIDEHFKKVVEKSLDTYQQTNGLFDITVFPLVEAWGFASKPLGKIPDSETIRSLMTCIGSKYLQLKNDTLLKLKSCIKIDVNGIAQGYTVDVIADFFTKKNVSDYIVEV